MQKTFNSDCFKKTGTKSRSCMCPHNRLPDARGERRPAECLERNLTVLSLVCAKRYGARELGFLSLDKQADVPTKDEYSSKPSTLDSVRGPFSVDSIHPRDATARWARRPEVNTGYFATNRTNGPVFQLFLDIRTMSERPSTRYSCAGCRTALLANVAD
jgi:hypothetical protein